MRRLIQILLLMAVATAGAGYTQENVGTTTGGPLLVKGVPIYGIADNGDLYWYLHRGYQNGTPDWANGGGRIKVGNGWNEGRFVFKGDPGGNDGVVYRIDSKGDLYWYKHLGFLSGSSQWLGGNKVGQGWQDSRLVFSGGPGIVYRVDNQGDLYWYRHLGYADGTARWSAATKVGNGWSTARFAFSEGSGIIYLIDQKGDLYWYRHLGYRTGAASWTDRKQVGNGWTAAASVLPGGDGRVYAMKRDGNLYWYRNTGFTTGTGTWAKSGAGEQIGTGWAEMVRMF